MDISHMVTNFSTNPLTAKGCDDNKSYTIILTFCELESIARYRFVFAWGGGDIIMDSITNVRKF